MKLKAILLSLAKFRKIDSFGLLPVAQVPGTAQRTADRIQS
jgi:hypothetical protein